MAVQVNDYATLTLHGDVMDNGAQKVMLNATIRADKSLHMSMEVLDPGYVAANAADVQEAVNAFLAAAFDKAAENGLPLQGGR